MIKSPFYRLTEATSEATSFPDLDKGKSPGNEVALVDQYIITCK